MSGPRVRQSQLNEAAHRVREATKALVVIDEITSLPTTGDGSAWMRLGEIKAIAMRGLQGLDPPTDFTDSLREAWRARDDRYGPRPLGSLLP